jgi:hypothetical protein
MNRNGKVLNAAKEVLSIVRNLERIGDKTNLYYSLECRINQVELEIYSGQVDDEFAQEMVDNVFRLILEEAQWASITVNK